MRRATSPGATTRCRRGSTPSARSSSARTSSRRRNRRGARTARASCPTTCKETTSRRPRRCRRRRLCAYAFSADYGDRDLELVPVQGAAQRPVPQDPSLAARPHAEGALEVLAGAENRGAMSLERPQRRAELVVERLQLLAAAALQALAVRDV